MQLQERWTVEEGIDRCRNQFGMTRKHEKRTEDVHLQRHYLHGGDCRASRLRRYTRNDGFFAGNDTTLGEWITKGGIRRGGFANAQNDNFF